MDAEHRHELKTNELATWLTQLPGWLKENTNVIIGVGLILIGLITWPMLSRMAKEKDIAKQTEITNSIQKLESDIVDAVTDKKLDAQGKKQALDMLLVNADALIESAGKLDNADLAALARIKAAQTYRTELQLRPEEVPAETVETQIKKAQDAYQKAFDQAETASVKAMAQLGLGLCLEELGQTQQAADLYQQIVKNEAYAATVVPAQAQSRLDFLAENISKVYFAPAPAVTETPAAEAPAAPAQPETTAPAQQPAADAPAAPELPAAPAPTETPAAAAEQNP